MHHFIYPSQDTFITNTPTLSNVNFGLDEILRVGTKTTVIDVVAPTSSYQYPNNSYAVTLCTKNFSGSLAGAFLSGSAASVIGYVADTCQDPVSFAVDYFSGSFSGYCSGWITGSYFTGSGDFELDGFSGSITIFSCSVYPDWNQIFIEYQNWETTWSYAQSTGGSIYGLISGSITAQFLSIFSGSISGFSGELFIGTILNGQNIINFPSTTTTVGIYPNRALVQFDLSSISEAIANGDIPPTQSYHLKMNVAREFELPVTYSLYAFALAESWMMGNGYLSDGGSPQGANWYYRDYNGGTPWRTSGSTYVTSTPITQSFNYQVGDIYMDITPMATAWAYGSANYGLVLISSDEFASTASGMDLRFFSKDTNTIYEPVLDVAWDDVSFVTGSISTSSINVGVISAGISASVSDSASINGAFYGCITGIGNISSNISYSLSYSISYSYDYTVPITNSVTLTSSFTSSIAGGFLSLMGTCGIITSMSLFGNFSGSISQSIVSVYSTCSSCRPNFHAGTGDFDNSKPFYPGAGDDGAYSVPIYYGSEPWVIDGQFPSQYGGCPNVPSFISSQLAYLNQPTSLGNLDVYGWNHKNNTFAQYDYWPLDITGQAQPYFSKGCSNCGPVMFTASYLMGTFLDGTVPGATFTSSLVNGYLIPNGYLVGSWNEGLLDGTTINVAYPFKPMFPNLVYASFTGSYVNGLAIGSILNYGNYTTSSYGIFNGIFVSGSLNGLNIWVPFSGSILTASIYYTASLNLQSSSLSPLDLTRPFATVVQNIPSTVKAGDIIKVNIFGRPQFPLKNFNRQTQFTQFLIPQYLPSSSYYAIKDNETEQIVLDFDQYTQLSCDPYGNYFNLDTTSFPQERYFKILIRVIENGNTYTFDKGNIFKIIR